MTTCENETLQSYVHKVLAKIHATKQRDKVKTLDKDVFNNMMRYDEMLRLCARLPTMRRQERKTALFTIRNLADILGEAYCIEQLTKDLPKI